MLIEIEATFRRLKTELGLRLIYSFTRLPEETLIGSKYSQRKYTGNESGLKTTFFTDYGRGEPSLKMEITPYLPGIHEKLFGNMKKLLGSCGTQKLMLYPTSTPFHQTAYMKSRLRLSCVVGNPRHSYGYDCGLRLANPSISFVS